MTHWNPTRRVLRTCLLVSFLLNPLQITAAAESTTTLPEPVVLVLKLVSKTHVKPTTGVVIHASGLVLIPAGFVAAGDEIVVLDGGTDIVRHARPAKTIRRSLSDGLAVLSVAGLERAPAVLSSGIQIEGEAFYFAAFPPARLIAEGAQPLGMQVRLESTDGGQRLKISNNAPLPNVAGPLFDQCGLLAGFNLATGTPSLEGDKLPRTLLGAELSDVLNAMELDLVRAPCLRTTEAETMSAQDPAGQAAGPEDSRLDSAPENVVTAKPPARADEQPQTAAEAPSVPMDQQSPVDQSPLPNQIPGNDRGASYTRIALLGALLLAAVLIGSIMRSRRTRISTSGDGASPELAQEPITEQLVALSEGIESGTGFAVSNPDEAAGSAPFEAGFDALLRVTGTCKNGAFKNHCGINSAQFSVLLTDDDGRELQFQKQRVRGPRALIEGRQGKEGQILTLSNPDGGSGLSVRGIPCLRNEMLHLGPGDEITLGEFRFTVKLKLRPERPA